MQNQILGIPNICGLLRVSTNQQRHCAADGEQWQQQWQQSSGTTIPLARAGCVTGVVVVVIIVSVTVSAFLSNYA